MLESLFTSATLLKKTPTQVFSCEYCELLKSVFYRTSSVIAFDYRLLKVPNLQKRVSRITFTKLEITCVEDPYNGTRWGGVYFHVLGK